MSGLSPIHFLGPVATGGPSELAAGVRRPASAAGAVGWMLQILDTSAVTSYLLHFA